MSLSLKSIFSKITKMAAQSRAIAPNLFTVYYITKKYDISGTTKDILEILGSVPQFVGLLLRFILVNFSWKLAVLATDDFWIRDHSSVSRFPWLYLPKNVGMVFMVTPTMATILSLKSSSSPPQPQKALLKPFNFAKTCGVMAKNQEFISPIIRHVKIVIILSESLWLRTC